MANTYTAELQRPLGSIKQTCNHAEYNNDDVGLQDMKSDQVQYKNLNCFHNILLDQLN